MYTINQLAKLSGVTVRALHYYDEEGLLTPARQKNGYRQYGEPELLKLQQILFFRELDFPIDDIKKILGQPDFKIFSALREHKKLIRMKQRRLQNLLLTIEKTIKHMTDQKNMKDEELYDAFKDDDVKQYQEEVKARWGNTDAYKQSMARVSKMTKKEMDELKKKGEELTKKLAASMKYGVESKEVQNLVSEHYKGIQYFYDCPLEMYRNLGKMYVQDPRFTKHYEKYAKGLAQFLCDAMGVFVDGKK